MVNGMADETTSEQQPIKKQPFKMPANLMGGEEFNREMAIKFGMAVYNDLSSYRISREQLLKIPYSFVNKNIVFPIKEEGDTVYVAVSDPLNLESLEELRLMLNAEIIAVYSSKETILHAINECYNREAGEATELIRNLGAAAEETKEDVDVYDLLDHSQEQAPVIKLLNLMLTEAIQQGASDIHFEPHDGGLRVRYRIDGILQNRHTPAPELQSPLLTRIKVMSKLDIAEHRLPQDGRIKLKMGRREIDFRVSTVPVSGGERIVLRILDKGNVIVGLDKLGMLPTVYNEFRRVIALPEGIVLVTGPTGSGKTTTLYSAICDIYNDEINIMTIEDPVEYNLKGIAQIGVKPKIKLDFARGLRHILRQDPDVIMIGEIRDKETAEIAVQASLTGHLVLSTLHTNDAPSAITRLVDMGIEPFLISSSLVGIVAQRLVRRICPDCKRPYQPSESELQSLGLKREDLIQGQLFHGEGCQSCYGTGYRGRHGLYEFVAINNAIRKQIVSSPDAIKLRQIALETGMVSLFKHGIELIRRGVTTVSEVLRVTRGVEEE